MNLIITDVTEMRRGHICVAGWWPAEGRMTRPLSGVGQHWDAVDGCPDGFWMGNIIRFDVIGKNNRGLPHSREDIIVEPKAALVDKLSGAELADRVRPSVASSVAMGFGGAIQKKKWVPGGTDCPSLTAINLRARDLHFEERPRTDKPPQLRCWFYSENVGYNLPVVGIASLKNWREGGLQAMDKLKAAHQNAHVRLGLTNPFEDGHCVIMVNGILFY